MNLNIIIHANTGDQTQTLFHSLAPFLGPVKRGTRS